MYIFGSAFSFSMLCLGETLFVYLLFAMYYLSFASYFLDNTEFLLLHLYRILHHELCGGHAEGISYLCQYSL